MIMANWQFPADARVCVRTHGTGRCSTDNWPHLGDKGVVIGRDLDGFVLVAWDKTGVSSYIPSGNDIAYLSRG